MVMTTSPIDMKTPNEFAITYVTELKNILDRLPLAVMDRMVQAMDDAHAARRQIFVIGNGGSAATASHMMNDLNKGTLGHNPVAEGSIGWPRFRVIALTDNVSLLSAWGNDTGYDYIFSEPLKNLAERGDLLIAISASGNSPNVIVAVEVAKQIGMKVIGWSGFGGGKLDKLADISLVVPSSEYGPVEDVHMILDHIITGYLYEKLKQAYAK
jgi:D-sedoheptulose 7-phosphate isomerase